MMYPSISTFVFLLGADKLQEDYPSSETLELSAINDFHIIISLLMSAFSLLISPITLSSYLLTPTESSATMNMLHNTHSQFRWTT